MDSTQSSTSDPDVNEPATSSADTESSESGTASDKPREPQFRILKDDFSSYNWRIPGTYGFTPTYYRARRNEDQQNVRNARQGDTVLMFNNQTDEPEIAALAQVAAPPEGYTEEGTGRRDRVALDLMNRIDEPVKLSKLEDALGHSLFIGSSPSCFLPLSSDLWTAIRSVILFHNPFVNIEKLAPPSVPERKDLALNFALMPDPSVADERISLSLEIRNSGNVTLDNVSLNIECQVYRRQNYRPGTREPAYVWGWDRTVYQKVAPGGLIAVSDLTEEAPSEPGSYDAEWLVTFWLGEGQIDAPGVLRKEVSFKVISRAELESHQHDVATETSSQPVAVESVEGGESTSSPQTSQGPIPAGSLRIDRPGPTPSTPS